MTHQQRTGTPTPTPPAALNLPEALTPERLAQLVKDTPGLRAHLINLRGSPAELQTVLYGAALTLGERGASEAARQIALRTHGHFTQHAAPDVLTRAAQQVTRGKAAGPRTALKLIGELLSNPVFMRYVTLLRPDLRGECAAGFLLTAGLSPHPGNIEWIREAFTYGILPMEKRRRADTVTIPNPDFPNLLPSPAPTSRRAMRA